MAIPTLRDLKIITSELNVLYVEDEAMIREGLSDSLRQLFNHVETAEDGAKGLESYQQFPFDLIITDISMPNMDGITMLQQIKEINPQARVIVTSAQNDTHKLLELINIGVDRFLTKPINKTLLVEALFAVCNAIDSLKKAETYRKQLEQKARLLNTYIKKEYLKNKTIEVSAIVPKAEVEIEEKHFEDYFSHILQEELDELIDLNEELDYDILLAFQNNRIDPSYVSRLAIRYSRYGSILSRHSVFAEIGMGLQTLGLEFSSHQQAFIDHIASLRELLESFNFTLITFRKNVLESSTSHPKFYNPSLLSDIMMITNLLNQTEIDGDIEFF